MPDADPTYDARKLGLTVTTQPTEVSLTIRAPEAPGGDDPTETAKKLGLTVQQTDNPLTTLSKAKSIGPVPMSAKAAEYLPLVGGLAGSAIAEAPGAAVGGMIGTRAEQYVNALTGYRHLPPQGEAAADILASGAEQGLLDVGGKAVGSVLRGPLRPISAADKALATANKELGLRLSAPEIVNKTASGMVGGAVEQMAERSVAGRVVADLNRQVTRRVAREGIVEGKAALNQVGDALHQVVTAGPSYDMLPHRVEAARLFSEDVAPKILDLYAKKLSPELTKKLLIVKAGRGMAPDFVQKLIPEVRKVIQRGQGAPVPTGTLDALESILQTADSASFDSATKLRTSLLEIGRRDDVVMGDRAKAVTKQFAGDLTDGLSAAYPVWDPLRSLYAKGAEAQRLPNVSAERATMIKEGPRAYSQAVKARTGNVPAGTEGHVLDNLKTLDSALGRVRASGGQWGDRIYRVFELSSAAGMLYTHGPGAAAASLSVTEVLPGLFVWAAHNPTMTKLLQEGITTHDTSKALTLIGRVMQGYLTAKQQAEQPQQQPQ